MASDLHKELSIRAISWMRSRMTRSGIRWATEFYLENGWVADAVAFAFPQIRYYDKIQPKPEPVDNFLYVFESKISRNDYNKSFRNGHKCKLIGNLHYVVTPKDLIKKEELPEGWGWLIKSGNGLREIVTPKYNPISEEFKYQLGYRMLWTAYNERSSIEDWELRSGKIF